MKKNNKGFSLVELLVFMAILGVVGSMAYMGYSTIHNANVGNAAGTINSYLSSIRLHNMSKIDIKYLHMYRINNTDYYYIDNNANINFDHKSKKIGGGSTSVTYVLNGVGTKLVNDNGITVSFNRSGECIVYNRNGIQLSASSLNRLEFYNATKSISIRVVPALGKTYIE